VEKKKKVFDIPTIVICAMFVIPVNFVWDTRAEAQTRTVTNKPSTQSITSSAPPLTPAEAAAIVSRLEHLPPPVICSGCDGPKIFIIGSRPGASSWLDFPPESPRRRLDGTLLTDPPATYGWSPSVLFVPAYPQEHQHRKHIDGKTPTTSHPVVLAPRKSVPTRAPHATSK